MAERMTPKDTPGGSGRSLRPAGDLRGRRDDPAQGGPWPEISGDEIEADDGENISLYFPVEIEVRTAALPVDPEELIQEALHRLAALMESR